MTKRQPISFPSGEKKLRLDELTIKRARVYQRTYLDELRDRESSLELMVDGLAQLKRQERGSSRKHSNVTREFNQVERELQQVRDDIAYEMAALNQRAQAS
jgi:hypothetical protein